MITQREISKLAFQAKVNDRVIEKDYVLTWLLFGLAGSAIAGQLAFKGGTSLKKIYFPGYRYSEDLDFTVLGAITSGDLVAGLTETLDRLAKAQGFQFALPENRIERRTDSLTAYVDFVGPLQGKLGGRDIKIDFTLTEKLEFLVEAKPVLSGYSDAIDRSIQAYSLEETVTEKLCAAIGRTEPRDIYDLHFLLGRSDVAVHLIPAAFVEKANSKKVDPARINEIFGKKQATLAKMWDIRLKHQVQDLPHLEQVLRELSRKFKEIGLLDLK
ncbi:MAG: nucleotidyl transferase AbiEii/AbiGii toxin family protein [Coriobacteriia bacterium]